MSLLVTLVLSLLFLRTAARLVHAELVLKLVRAGARGLLAGLGFLLPLPFRALRAVASVWGDTRATARCSRGCGRQVPLVGLVTCSACGYRSRRGAFRPCPACGRCLTHLSCPYCATSIPRPGLDLARERPPRRFA